MKGLKICLGIIVILITVNLILYFTPKPKEKEKEEKISSLEQVQEILTEEDSSFLSWIDSNYKDSMKEMLTLLKKDAYQKEMWHQVTGYSYLVL